MTIAVTGGRSYANHRAVFAALDVLHSQRPITKLVHGDAFGADRIAEGWARQKGITVIAYPADWKRHGKSAGPRRNGHMLRETRPKLLLAFPGGPGTANCVQQAEQLKIEIVRVT